MEYKKLGKTGLDISAVGLGVGGVLGLKVFNEQKALKLIQTAIDKGINFFDTGSAYSYGNAEIRLGKVIKNNKSIRDKLIIATKGGTVHVGKNKFIKDFSRKSLTKFLHQSLKKLNVEHIDLYQLHSPSLHHLTDDVLETLEIFKSQGKIRFTGISCGGQVLDKAIKIPIFDTVMVTYNILHQNTYSQLKKAKEYGKGTLIKSPMAHVIYSPKIFKIKNIADIWYFLRILKNYRSQLSKGRKYRFINNIDGWTGPQIALKFVLENEYVDCAVTGTTRISNLLSNIETVNKNIDPVIIQKLINHTP